MRRPPRRRGSRAARPARPGSAASRLARSSRAAASLPKTGATGLLSRVDATTKPASCTATTSANGTRSSRPRWASGRGSRVAAQEVLEEHAGEAPEATAEAAVARVDDDLLVAHGPHHRVRGRERLALHRERDAALHRLEGGSRELGRVVEVEELRGREALVGVADLCEAAAGDAEREPVRVLRPLRPDARDAEPERHGLLAHPQRSQRVQHERLGCGVDRAQRHEQRALRRQLGVPALALAELARRAARAPRAAAG